MELIINVSHFRLPVDPNEKNPKNVQKAPNCDNCSNLKEVRRKGKEYDEEHVALLRRSQNEESVKDQRTNEAVVGADQRVESGNVLKGKDEGRNQKE